MTRTGVVFRPQSAPEELRGVAEAVQAAGVEELWLWEDCFLEAGPSCAAAALAWTETVHVGIGLLPVPLRNAAVTAMEAASLAGMFPGRVTVALGHGVLDWMGQVGARVESPMTLLEEYTRAVRSLLAGELVDVSGRYVQLADVRLDWPPQVPPRLLIGARGPRTVALAGQVSDGVLLDSVADAEAVAAARELVGPAADIVVYAEVAPTQAASRITELADAGADCVVLQAPGESPDPRPLLDAL